MKQVLKIVEAAVQKKEVKLEGAISQGWWNRFHERWPQLTLRKGDSFPIIREQMTCKVFEGYFTLLKETLQKYVRREGKEKKRRTGGEREEEEGSRS